MSLVADSRHADRLIASPNFNVRRGVDAPDLLILHYTGMETADDAVERLTAAGSDVSCHYLVFEDGRIAQMVAEAERAWHAGVASWGGASDINSRSIGVEIVNSGHDYGYPDFPGIQIESVTALCKDICVRHALKAQHVLAHSDVAPGRKRDPGEKFPWGRLAEEGVGHWVAPEAAGVAAGPGPGDSGPEVSALKAALADYGYGVDRDDVFDAATFDVVVAFQRHFRPERVDGIADRSTVTTLQRLLAALTPVG
ncbi:N-acetylmuramoyl-L-alanine amidase [Rhodobium gokarnense]|uniref:N-acetylmuramoyl-L-alanine amidase n=1 Tax=Rhodobium gokarnense TaxID=364296 RepID=A0ABT3H9T3_9HYPH|nr:N-acetylmuramoyl-L-alanine amidase [Rhodobium gokarnense]MCW2307051.1 N-acetylmuramoyl-L-alanine amidase [Rhodobium gokarnense]